MKANHKRLLNDYQRDFPLVARPFAAIGEELGMSEADVIEAYGALAKEHYISRIGAVIAPNSIGASTLAAMQVPEDRLEAVAALISGFDEVNHNYQREHAYNLWFVIAADDQHRIDQVIALIERKTRLAVMDLPMIKPYHLDLGFDLQWT